MIACHQVLMLSIVISILPTVSGFFTQPSLLASLHRSTTTMESDSILLSDKSSMTAVPSSGLIPYIGKTEFNASLTFDTFPTFIQKKKWQERQTSFNLWKQLPWKKIPGKGTLKVKISGTIGIEPSRPSGFLSGGGDLEVVSTLPDLTNLFQYAAYDPRVLGILVEIDTLDTGYAGLTEIRRLMHFFRQSGKPLIGYAASASAKELFLSLECDEFYMPPDGSLDLRGFSAAATFLRGIFDKVGIQPQVQRIGKYKSFGDTFNRTVISEAQREVLSSLLMESSEFWANSVALKRNMSSDDVRNIWTEEGFYGVDHWAALGLIHGVKYLDQVEGLMARKTLQMKYPLIAMFSKASFKEAVEKEFNNLAINEHSDFNLTREFEMYPRRNALINSTLEVEKPSLADMAVKMFVKANKQLKQLPAGVYLRKMQKGSRILRGLLVKEVSAGPRIAIINAAGGISSGKSSQTGLNGKTLGSDSFIALIKRAQNDPGVKAVVIRVDSPGGSALASDLMWRAIRELSKVKPVVASMVNVAASGGYYISMACDHILAEELTITGSIGVVTSKFNLEVLNERVGYGVETVSRGRYAEVLSSSRGFTAEEEKYFADSAIKAYKSFTTKAAASRGMSIEEMEKVAQGRVWTGRQALNVGLVDEIGGLWSAINVASNLAGLPKIGGKDAINVEVLRDRNQGLNLPTALLSRVLSFFDATIAAPAKYDVRAEVEDAYSSFSGTSSNFVARILGSVAIDEKSVLSILAELL